MKHQLSFLHGISVSVLCIALATNACAQNLGVGNSSPASKLDIKGNLTVGSTYSGTAAPVSGAIFEGNVGIGTTAPAQKLHVVGTVRISTISGASNVGSPTAFVTTDANGDMGRYNATFPPAGSTLELWYRPSGAPYIQPVSNSSIRVYDVSPTQPYGIYYDGSSNTVGAYFRTTSATNGTAAVEGFSDVTSQQTFGYLGWVGTYPAGNLGTINGMAVYGQVDDSNRVAGFFRTTGNANFAANVNYSDVWTGSTSEVDFNKSGTFANGPYGATGTLNVLNSTFSNTYQAGVYGYASRGILPPGTGTTVGVWGLANAQNENSFGVLGEAYSNAGGAGLVFGGAFAAYKYNSAALSGYVYVGGQNAGSIYKISGVGTAGEIIPTKDHGRIDLTCPESPEYWYEDYGTVQMVNGKAHVDLDPILADIIVVDAQNPLKVFCTQVDITDFQGVTIENRSATGFDIAELNGGSHSGEIDYEVVAKPKTNYGVGRFPQAPPPPGATDMNIPGAKAANDGRGVKFTWPSDVEVYHYTIPNHQSPPSIQSSENK